jgi:OHCU decarboxylase
MGALGYFWFSSFLFAGGWSESPSLSTGGNHQKRPAKMISKTVRASYHHGMNQGNNTGSLNRCPVSELNQLDRPGFVRMIGPVFEHSPWIAEATWPKKPFTGLEQLHSALCETVNTAGEEKQLALIRAHPDLVGRAALAGTLTRESTGEQASAGLGQLSPQEIQLFQKNNAAYREKFGFPFVICARLNKKEAILAGFERRLKNSPAQEIHAALEEIFKIAELRLRDVISPKA